MSPKPRPRTASWTLVQLRREDQLRRRLQKRHWLRLHAVLTGGISLGVMSLLSLVLLHAGVHSMALRYGVALAGGYLLYLLLVRLWVDCMLRRDWNPGDVPVDVPGSSVRTSGPDAAASLESRQGGSYGGGGATGDWGGDPAQLLDSGPALGEVAGPASSGIDIPDIEGVVIVPVLLLFAALLVAVTGAGSLLWLVFGAELFLTVAVEVAFALLMARTLYVVEREGWLLAALRISWKPVLGALVTAVLLGALADWLFPRADTLVQVLGGLRSYWFFSAL